MSTYSPTSEQEFWPPPPQVEPNAKGARHDAQHTAHARVLARQVAIRLAKDELARHGLRVHSVPMRKIQIEADALLRQRPELIEEAAELIAAHPEKWLPKRALQTCNAKRGTDIVGELTSAIFSASCSLFTY